MHILEQMMKETILLLQETVRRQRALKRILHVLNIAIQQKEHTRIAIILMLNYEENRQKSLLEQKWRKHRISRKQKKEYEKSIQLYKEYIHMLIEHVDKG